MKSHIIKGSFISFVYIIVFVFFSLCPFILPITESDVQPYAFLLSSFLVIASLTKPITNISIIIVLFTALLAIILFFFQPEPFALRLLYGYVSFLFVLVATYYCSLKYGDNLEPVIKAVILLWFIVGLLQVFGDKLFLSSLVSGARTTSSRGVFGLASEPSFFGVQCFYFLFLTSLFKSRKLFYIGLCSIMSVFMAESTLGVIFLFFYIVLFTFDTRNLSYIILVTFIVFAVGMYIILDDSGGRLSHLVSEFFSMNLDSFEEDQSLTIRLNSVLNSWESVTSSFFMPHGFVDRFGCLIGDLLFVFGFMGFPLLYVILHVLARSFKHKDIVFAAFVIFSLLFNSNIQIANPTLAFVLGCLLGHQSKK